MFTQVLDPLGNLTLTCLVALIPVVFLLVLLAVFRTPAWIATALGSLVTFALAVVVWKMPLDTGMQAYLNGSATGVWAVDWITFWGLILFNTLSLTGLFENFRRWLIAQGSLDVRVQTMLFAWAFGALLEGLVGFGYPWAVVAPILISLGISDLNAIRVAAIDNGPMDAALMESGLVTHVRADGFRYRPQKPVDWLVCDMVEQPRRVAALMAQWFAEGLCRHAIFNLKLPMKKRYEETRLCLDLLADALDGKADIRAKQLYHDREEITVFARRA